MRDFPFRSRKSVAATFVVSSRLLEVPRSPAKSREVPRSPAKSREVPRSPAKSREVPRSPAKSREVPSASNFIANRHHFTPGLIAAHNQQLTGQQQCLAKIQFHALEPVMQPAIMDLFSSITGFFVGRRHQLVQSLPASIIIALISTPSGSTLFAHRYRPTFDLIEAQDQRLI